MFSTTYNKVEKLWYGCDVSPLYNPNVSVAQVLLNAMTIFGPKVAQISDNDGVSLTFDDIRIRTIRAAQNLRVRGYKPKQTFLILAGNSQNVAPIAFASLANGCPLHCLDPSFEKSELIRLMNITKPVAMFCDVSCYDTLKESLLETKSDAKVFTFDGCRGESEPVEHLFKETNKENQFIPVPVDGPNETAIIVCSSGTTGASKAVCMSHAALLDGAIRFNINTFSDIMLTFSSLYWLSGSIMLVLGTLSGATRIMTTEQFSPELQLHLIEKYKVTLALNPPHQVVLMMKNERFNKTDLSSLKHQFIGGSKVPLYLKQEMTRLVPNCEVYVGYGMSETAGAISIDYPASNEKDTIGKLANGVQAKIIDENGNRCDANVQGEICVKTAYKFLGYHSNQQATDELFDEEGFIKTGDIGCFDKDGYLYIVDRKKDLLRYCYEDVSPSELEAYLIQSPHIKSACVVGVPDAMGDLPAAAIVRTDGSNITETEIYNLIADNFKDYCKLRGGIYFMDSFPTTPSGKVLRRQVMKTAVARFNDCKA